MPRRMFKAESFKYTLSLHIHPKIMFFQSEKNSEKKVVGTYSPLGVQPPSLNTFIPIGVTHTLREVEQ